MPASLDLGFATLDSPQSGSVLPPNTLPSAATIAPINMVTFISGTVQIATITPPAAGAHMLVLIFTNASPGAFLTSGNIKTATAPAQNIPVILIWDPISAKYWSGKLS